jgi:hypothetical protein
MRELNFSQFLKDHAIVPFLAVLAVFFWFDFSDRYKYGYSVEQVSGLISKADVVWQGSTRSQSQGRVFRIKYSFQYDSQSYESDRIFPISRKASSEEETALLKAFRENQSIKVYVPKGNPAFSFLLPATPNQLFEATTRWMILVGLYLSFLTARFFYIFANNNWKKT